jgi:hypothetical protein
MITITTKQNILREHHNEKSCSDIFDDRSWQPNQRKEETDNASSFQFKQKLIIPLPRNS